MKIYTKNTEIKIILCLKVNKSVEKSDNVQN